MDKGGWTREGEGGMETRELGKGVRNGTSESEGGMEKGREVSRRISVSHRSPI